jgi:hypothetical protein
MTDGDSMIELPVRVEIPFLWGDRVFEKNSWGGINFLVGPNGTGKTVFARELISLLPRVCPELHPRFISSDRLRGFEPWQRSDEADSPLLEGIRYEDFERWRQEGEDYGLSSAALVILKEKLDVRLRIEASLSQLFRRRLELVENNGGFTPRLSRIAGGWEYGLRQDECHGLKELITLLTFLYDDEFNCLIIDEPELHLHPQFQTFLMQEIRALSGNPVENPGSRLFFLVTHSPYFVDLRTVDDLLHCLVFRPDIPPGFISRLDEPDSRLLKRFLPRLNTHHKQFFFSVRPVFVEGYTDQQIFSLLQERRGRLTGAAGESFIDVGGKDELDLFFRLCRRLGIQAQLVTDLDALFGGRLLRTLSNAEFTGGVATEIGADEQDFLAGLKRRMFMLAREAARSRSFREANGIMRGFVRELRSRNEEESRVYAFYLGLAHHPGEVKRLIPGRSAELESILRLMGRVIEILAGHGVHVLSRGQLEHYLPSHGGNLIYHFPESAKRMIFERERDFILSRAVDEIRLMRRYGGLIRVLDRAVNYIRVDVSEFLSVHLRDFLTRLDNLVRSGEVSGRDSLLARQELDYGLFSRIFQLEEFLVSGDGYKGKIRMDARVDPRRRTIEFDERTLLESTELKNQT